MSVPNLGAMRAVADRLERVGFFRLWWSQCLVQSTDNGSHVLNFSAVLLGVPGFLLLDSGSSLQPVDLLFDRGNGIPNPSAQSRLVGFFTQQPLTLVANESDQVRVTSRLLYLRNRRALERDTLLPFIQPYA